MKYLFEPIPVVSLAIAGRAERFPVRRVYCVGRNYVEHAKEMGFSGREPPFFFLKPNDAVVTGDAGATLAMPYPSLTKSLHHELELVVAIGTGGRNIPAAEAERHIFGYAVGLDMTRRDLQNDMKKQGRPWSIGKGFEQSAPIGPVHPIARTGRLVRGAITLEVNGTVRQKGDLADLIWSVDETIAQLSAAWLLQPGDLVFTGTPAGVGAVQQGDLMRGTIEGLGTLAVAVH